ncbi:glycine cleavage system protein GcvH [Thermocrinis minervae]|uniref:Glycine cleavage system H protein n=1 Tax=Thermocrinis minervae TaxID=381751 RepID=A0A1M6TCG6_9AQUI|nr:glycine cleavage system H protein [Thermocrinis minervae]
MDEITVGKYIVLKDRYYTKEHEWVLVKGKKAWVGITDYAQKELGDIVYVDLPEKDSHYEAGDVLVNLESVKNVAPVYAPVSGTVVEVNSQLQDEPQLVNESPYEDGWLVVLEMDDPAELEDLLTAEDYAQMLADIIKEERVESISIGTPPEESFEESLDALPEDIPYEDKER